LYKIQSSSIAIIISNDWDILTIGLAKRQEYICYNDKNI